jgi:hypothetical protein
MVRSRTELVFILERHFILKPFTAVSEALSNAYTDKEVPNNTTILISSVSLHTALFCVAFFISYDLFRVFEKERYNFKEYINLYKGHTQRFELS